MLDQSNTYNGSFDKLRKERKEFHTGFIEGKIEKNKRINIHMGKVKYGTY